MEAEHSRALRLAGEASGRSEPALLAHLQGSRVQVSVEAGRADVAQTATVILDTLRRLPIGLTLCEGPFAERHGAVLVGRAEAIDPRRGLSIGGHGDPGLRIHVGGSAAAADIVAMPERHGGHVARGEAALGQTRPASGLGAMSTAALVCGEAFKTLAQVMPSRMSARERISWCPVTLSEDPSATPVLPETHLELAIVGLGAIGTAVTHTLSMLALSGTAMLVDPERFSRENLGTYSLGGIGEAEQGMRKTDLAAAALPRFTTLRYPMPVQALIEQIDAGRAPWPRLVLSGLDSAVARRETQRLWPDRLIDGATGDTSCGLHDVHAGSGRACLQCLFAVRTDGPSSAERLSTATGLPAELLRHGDQPLTEAHIDALADAQRRALEAHVGKPICGLADAVGLSALAGEDYRPAVPFVAQQAACLVAGRLVATILGVPPQPGFVQYDTLVGPDCRVQEDRRPSPGCFCQQRAEIVSTVRGARARRALG
jgi:hypothetical protein